MLQNNTNSFYFTISHLYDFLIFYPQRLLIDIARHFLPIDMIKRNIDALEVIKTQIFYYHLVDHQGWRVEIKKHVKIKGLAEDGTYYTQ